MAARIGVPIMLAGAAVILLATVMGGRALPTIGAPATVATGADQWAGLRPGGRWVRVGLRGQVDALLADPRRRGLLFAGTDDGIWRSTDGGATWQHVGSALHGAEVFALTATPRCGLLFAGAADGAVYASVAGMGTTWWRISPPLSANPIFSLAVSPSSGRTVLAGTVGALFRGDRSGGRWTWRRVAGTLDAAVTSIAWAPWDTRLAFASVFGVDPPVLATHDGGQTWRTDSRGLPSALPTQALLVLGVHPPRIFLSTMGDGVWLRTPTGMWQDVSAGLPGRHAMPLGAPGRADMVLYAGTMGYGVYAKHGSAPWRRFGRGLDGAAYTVLSLLPISGSHPAMLAGTARGLFRYLPPT